MWLATEREGGGWKAYFQSATGVAAPELGPADQMARERTVIHVDPIWLETLRTGITFTSGAELHGPLIADLLRNPVLLTDPTTRALLRLFRSADSSAQNPIDTMRHSVRIQLNYTNYNERRRESLQPRVGWSSYSLDQLPQLMAFDLATQHRNQGFADFISQALQQRESSEVLTENHVEGGRHCSSQWYRDLLQRALSQLLGPETMESMYESSINTFSCVELGEYILPEWVALPNHPATLPNALPLLTNRVNYLGDGKEDEDLIPTETSTAIADEETDEDNYIEEDSDEDEILLNSSKARATRAFSCVYLRRTALLQGIW